MDIKSIIGHSVVHPTCGEGIINNVDDQFVWVEYNEVGVKKYQFPQAFSKFLTIDDEQIQKEILKEGKKRIEKSYLVKQVLSSQSVLTPAHIIKQNTTSETIIDDALLREVWRALDAEYTKGFQPRFSNFAEILKKLQPEISYSDYKKLLNNNKKRLSNRYSYTIVPSEFEQISKSFICSKNPSKVFVPFATGLECDFFNSNENVEYLFHDEDIKKATSTIININTCDDMPKEGNYDLILSLLPLGPINNHFVSCQIVEQCAQLLADDGYCIFTFSKSISTSSAEKWLSQLEKKGLNIEAIIDVPMGAYAPVTNAESEIVIFSRKKTQKLFVGMINEENIAEKIVDNFLKKRASNSDAKLGTYVDGKIKCFSDYKRDLQIKSKNTMLAKSYNARLLSISEIGIVHAPNKNNEFKECEGAIYVPKLGRSPVVTSIADLKIKAQNYFQVVINTEIALPRFLAFFLNTEEGVNLRELSYHGVTIKAFNTKSLGEMVVPCPTVELQSEYLKTFDRLEMLLVEVESLKDKLQKIPASYKNIRKEIRDINNTGDRFIQWIESLPYPIATILKRYSVAEDSSQKQEILFHFYEAYAIFLSTLLSAALKKNLIDCSKLKGVDPAFFEKASFGNWVRMDRALSNLYLEAVNGSDNEKKKAVLECFKTTDTNLVKLLCNKNVCNILENASGYRNTWKGHSGITSEVLYKEHVDNLDGMLHKLQGAIRDLYERVRLVRPVSLTYSNEIFSNRVEVLTGSNPIFMKDTIVSSTPLDNSKLYLQILDTGEMIDLPPYFILKQSPSDAKNACYFYSRVEKGNTRYISYHYDGKPEDIETGEAVYEHIRSLLTN